MADRITKADLEKQIHEAIYGGRKVERKGNNTYIDGVLSEDKNLNREITAFLVAEMMRVQDLFTEDGKYEEVAVPETPESTVVEEKAEEINQETPAPDSEQRIYLITVKEDKEKVAALGAKWDGKMYRWYFSNEADRDKFEMWIPKYLNVSFKEKEDVKALGAKWDQNERAWYYLNPEDKDKFTQWLRDDDIISKTKDISDVLKSLEDGVEKLLNQDEYKSFLKVMARMPHYSFRNTIMVYLQNPDATLVASPKRMVKTVGHQVKDEEKENPIYLLRPNEVVLTPDKLIQKVKNSGEKGFKVSRYLLKAEEGNTISIVDVTTGEMGRMNEKDVAAFLREKKISIKAYGEPRFLPFAAYDVKQAEPIMITRDGKEQMHPLAVEYLEKLQYDRMFEAGIENSERNNDITSIMQLYEAVGRVSEYPITYDNPMRGENGYFSRLEKKINITPTISPTKAMGTLVHEVGHSVLHANEDAMQMSKQDKEVQAESVAYVICTHYGIDTSGYSFNYIAGWGRESETVEKSLEIIRKTSNELIEKIDKELETVRKMDILQGKFVQNPIFAKHLIGQEISFQLPETEIENPVEKEDILADIEEIRNGNIVAISIEYSKIFQMNQAYILYPNGMKEVIREYDAAGMNNQEISEENKAIESSVREFADRLKAKGYEADVKVYSIEDFSVLENKLLEEKRDFFDYEKQDYPDATYEELIPEFVESIEKGEKLYSFKTIQAYTEISKELKLDLNSLRKMMLYDGVVGNTSSFTNYVLENAEEIAKGKTASIETLEEAAQITLFVSECGEFHDMGEFYDGIENVDEAIAAFNRIPPERMNGIPTIGINVKSHGRESEINVISANGYVDYDIIQRIPEIAGNDKAMNMIRELEQKMNPNRNLVEENVAAEMTTITEVNEITPETENHLVYYTKNLGGTGRNEDTVPVKYASFDEALDSYINANVDGKELGCLVNGKYEASLASFRTVDMNHTHVNKTALVRIHPFLTQDDYEQISSNISLLENAIKKDDVYNKLNEGFDTVATSAFSSIVRSDSEWGSWFGRVVNQEKPQDYVEIAITGYSTHHQISYEITLVRDNNVVSSKMITAETNQENFEQSVRNAFETSKKEILSYFKECADVLDIDIDSHMEIYSPFSEHSLEEHYDMLKPNKMAYRIGDYSIMVANLPEFDSMEPFVYSIYDKNDILLEDKTKSWLRNMDNVFEEAVGVLKKTYGVDVDSYEKQDRDYRVLESSYQIMGIRIEDRFFVADKDEEGVKCNVYDMNSKLLCVAQKRYSSFRMAINKMVKYLRSSYEDELIGKVSVSSKSEPISRDDCQKIIAGEKVVIEGYEPPREPEIKAYRVGNYSFSIEEKEDNYRYAIYDSTDVVIADGVFSKEKREEMPESIENDINMGLYGRAQISPVDKEQRTDVQELLAKEQISGVVVGDRSVIAMKNAEGEFSYRLYDGEGRFLFDSGNLGGYTSSNYIVSLHETIDYTVNSLKDRGIVHTDSITKILPVDRCRKLVTGEEEVQNPVESKAQEKKESQEPSVEKEVDITQIYKDGLGLIHDEESYKAYLDFASKIPNYSFRNTMMIYSQNPDAKYVASSYKMVTSFGHRVKDEEAGKPIYLWKPNEIVVNLDEVLKKIELAGEAGFHKNQYSITKTSAGYKVRNAYAGTESVMTLKSLETFMKTNGIVGKVYGEPKFVAFKAYDISQTEYIPALDREDNLVKTSQAAEWQELFPAKESFLADRKLDKWGKMQQLLSAFSSANASYVVSFSGIDNAGISHTGNQKVITVNPDLSMEQSIKSAICQIVASELEGRIKAETPEHIKAAQIATAEYVTCSHYGIDVSDYNFDLNSYEGKELEAIFNAVQPVFNEFTSRLDRKVEDMLRKTIKIQDIPIEQEPEKEPTEEIRPEAAQETEETISDLEKMLLPYEKQLSDEEKSLIVMYAEIASMPDVQKCIEKTAQKSYGIMHEGSASNMLRCTVVVALERAIEDISISDEKKALYEANKKELEDIIEGRINQQQDVTVTVMQLKNDRMEKYAGMSMEDNERYGIDVKIDNYTSIARVEYKNVGVLEAMEAVYQMGHKFDETLNDVALKAYELQEVEQELYSVNTGDVLKVEVTRENQASMTQYFYINDKGFAELGKEFHLPEKQQSMEFLQLYQSYPEMAIQTIGDVTELQAKVMAQIDKEILPVPANGEELEAYVRRGRSLANEILKQTDAVLVGKTEAQLVKSGEVYELQRFAEKIAVESQAIYDAGAQIKEPVNITVFTRDGNQITSYHTTYDVGGDIPVAEFLERSIQKDIERVEGYINTGMVCGREVTSKEMIQYKASLTGYEQTLEAVRKKELAKQRHKVENQKQQERNQEVSQKETPKKPRIHIG
ncbi:MAG: hypothetical protein J6J86_09650 [Lachnospiraceae bacterium]|nr:hypothetical protein [Lachnospiraceae bacterium]